MTVVVLGWDGLDPDRLECLECADAFGTHRTRIDTIVNDTLGTPHTYELWPTLLTGMRPREHGVRAEAYVQGGAWDSWLLNALTALSRPLPEAWRRAVGTRLRDRGASMQHRRLDSYDWTALDDFGSVSIAIPNARSPTDDQLGIASDRGAALGQYLNRAEGAREATVPLQTLDQRLWHEAAGKLGAVAASVRHGADVVWVWLGVLDTAGHVAPTVENGEAWLRQHYERAAEWTQQIRSHKTADLVVSVSDHGLQDGRHTETAVLGCDDASVLRDVDDVTDVAEAVADVVSATARTGHSATENTAEVRQQLDALGYI